MGLLPLEFSDCLLDSPYFRENLKAHEKQLDQTSTDIKVLLKDMSDVLEGARTLSKAKRALASTLAAFHFDCLGTSLTDDEVIIANSLREFSRFFTHTEDEMDRMLDHAAEKFLVPLEQFRKEQLGSVKKTKKEFEKQTSRFCAAQDRYIGISSKKEESLAEAAEGLRLERKLLNAASLDYVHALHLVQERKKFEFVEAILNFMAAWALYHRHGHAVVADYSSYMEDLQARVQKTRQSFSATQEQYDSLKSRVQTGHADPGSQNRMYTRQGYLYVQKERKNHQLKLGSGWTKYFCQYQAKDRVLTLIPYSQLSGKITTTESLKVHECICKEETAEKFRFVVSGEDLTEQGCLVSHTFQAVSDFERKQWVESLGGTWPAVNTLQRIRADSVEDNLHSLAFTFLKDCLAELEHRDLTEQGLYRVGGVVSKVKRLLSQGLMDTPSSPSAGEDDRIDLSDPKQWESKTIASAIKQYFRDLSKPLMTHQLYPTFLEAVKTEGEEARLSKIGMALQQLPPANQEMLKVLIRHLQKVTAKSQLNLMSAANLGVCFGPTLLRPKDETVASIMEIKFCNQVVEILIEHCDRYFGAHAARRGSGNSSSNDQHDDYRRTQSFSSFSSLPEIKEQQQQNSPSHAAEAPVDGHSRASPPSPAVDALDGVPLRIVGSTNSVRPRSRSHQHHPPALKKPLVKSLTQDDLMASLELMHKLAEDLPSNASPLRRSLTLQVARKPPLPRLAIPESVGQPDQGVQKLLKSRQVSTPSPSTASTMSSSSSGESSSSPRFRHIRASSEDIPAPPARRYKHIFVSPAALQEHAQQVAAQAASLRAQSTGSPSPPAGDSGLGTLKGSSGGLSDDGVASVASSALSDHVLKSHQTRDEDGDDEADEDSLGAASSSSESCLSDDHLVVDSSGTESGDLLRSGAPAAAEDLSSTSTTSTAFIRLRSNRDSGPYDNVAWNEHKRNELNLEQAEKAGKKNSIDMSVLLKSHASQV